MINNSLRTRLIVSFMALAIGPLLLTGVIIAWQSFRVQRAQALTLQSEIARRAAIQIESFLGEIQHELKLIAHLEGLLTLQPAQQQQIFAHMLTHQHSTYGPTFDQIILSDAAGQELIRVSRLGDDTLARSDTRLPLSALKTLLTTSRVYFSPVGFTDGTNEPLITLAIPVEDLRSGAVTGVLAADIRLKMLWDTMAAIDVGKSGLAYIVDNTGRLIAHPDPSEVLRGVVFPAPDHAGIQRGLQGRPVVLTSQSLALGQQSVYLLTEVPLAEALAPTRNTIAVIGGLLLVVVFAAIELGILLNRHIVQPIETLAVTARAIESGDLSQRVNIRRADEIGALADAFDAMADRLQHTIDHLETHTDELEQTSEALREIGQALDESLRKEKELHDLKSHFVSVVSHEFRTPLTSIQSSTEILEQYHAQLSPEKQRQHLRRIRMNVETMTRLLHEVIFIGHLDSGKRVLQPALLDPSQVCGDIIEEMRQTCSATCAIRFVAQAECRLMMDEHILRHILTNLLSNAIKYSPDGSPVALDIGCEAEHVILTVRDSGLGIPEAEQTALFEAFHRGSNVAGISGSGLGLSIVKRCVDLYRGNITVTSREGQGTTVVVTLPVGSPANQEDSDEKNPGD